MNIFDYLNINGHVTIHKVHEDGQEELIYDDHNVIVEGMGIGLACLFGLSGATSILDYQIDRFQIGVSGGEEREVSSTKTLSGPLSSFLEYVGEDGELFPVSGNMMQGTTFNGNTHWYAAIPAHNITRIGANSVRFTINIDKDSCNNLRTTSTYLNEIGLFMRNPLGLNPTAPMMVAYKYFSPVRKTQDFALILRWTINF